jgi:glycosyltransferase involved in cell wall biosynthesis
MALARGLTEEKRAPNPSQCTVATETPKGTASDVDLPFRVVRRPNILKLTRLIWQADLVHVAGPALRPLILGRLFRKKMVVEHHGFHAVCPNGLLFYEPTGTACSGHFRAGNYSECWKCNAGCGNLRSWRLWALTFLRRWSCRFVAANIAPTRSVAHLLQLPHTVVIPHGVAETRSVTLPSRNHPKFAFLGRLVSTKGVELLLCACRELQSKGFDFHVVIIGDGPERNRLEALSAALALREVEFVGQLSDGDVNLLTSDALAVVIPSRAGEVFGLVAAESMMRGHAVIVPDEGALAEIVGQNGLKFAAGNATSLADSMEYLLRSPAAANQLGARAHGCALTRFRAEQMSERHLGLYREVLK